jgi:hypothetical protein
MEFWKMKKIYSFSSLEVADILLEVLYERSLIIKEQLEDPDNELNFIKYAGNGAYELQIVLNELD